MSSSTPSFIRNLSAFVIGGALSSFAVSAAPPTDADVASFVGFAGKGSDMPISSQDLGTPVATMAFGEAGFFVVSRENLDARSSSGEPLKLQRIDISPTWLAGARSNDGGLMALGLPDSRSPETGSVIVRYDERGKLDPQFGTAGMASIPGLLGPEGPLVIPTAMAALADGALLVGGLTISPESSSRFGVFVVRLNKDGTIDRRYGRDGFSLQGAGSRIVDVSVSLVASSDDSAVVLATQFLDGENGPRADVWVRRVDARGLADKSFGVGLQFHPDDAAAHFLPTRLVRHPIDGTYSILGGERSGDTDGRCGVLRIDAKGRVVKSFAAGGRLRLAIAKASSCTLTDALLARDKSLLLLGVASYKDKQAPDDAYVRTFAKKLDLAAQAGTTATTPPEYAAVSRKFIANPSKGQGLAASGSRVLAFIECETQVRTLNDDCRLGGRLVDLR